MKEDVHVRISGEIMSKVRAYAVRYGLTLAAAATVLLQRGLETEKT